MVECPKNGFNMFFVHIWASPLTWTCHTLGWECWLMIYYIVSLVWCNELVLPCPFNCCIRFATSWHKLWKQDNWKITRHGNKLGFYGGKLGRTRGFRPLHTGDRSSTLNESTRKNLRIDSGIHLGDCLQTLK